MILKGIASRASIDQGGGFIAEGALYWHALDAIPLRLKHRDGGSIGTIKGLWREGKELICVAHIDDALLSARDFILRHRRTLGFSVGTADTKGTRAGHMVIVSAARIAEISLTEQPAHADCRVQEVYGLGLDSGMDEHWLAVAMARPVRLNLPPIRYLEQEPA